MFWVCDYLSMPYHQCCFTWSLWRLEPENHWVNTLKLGRKGHHFTDNMFICICNEKVRIFVKMSLKLLFNDPAVVFLLGRKLLIARIWYIKYILLYTYSFVITQWKLLLQYKKSHLSWVTQQNYTDIIYGLHIFKWQIFLNLIKLNHVYVSLLG